MEKSYKITFCDCCGKRIFQTDKHSSELNATFTAYWKDDTDLYKDTQYDIYKNGHHYRCIVPEEDINLEDANHEIYRDSRASDKYLLKLDNVCEDCTRKVISELCGIRDSLKNIAKPVKEVDTTGLEDFSVEQLQAEIEKRNSNKD